jgi:serine/threonine-protein kinase
VLKGKIPYMAPEQILADPLDRRADIFAAGAVLWEMCTQRRRIHAENEAAMMHMILAGQKDSPRDVNPSVPQAISQVCMWALALAPDHRYATAADFAEGLEQAAHAEGIRIASPRALSAFIKGLGIKRPSPEELAAAARYSDQGTPSTPTRAPTQAVSAQEPRSSVPDVRSETNAAVVSGVSDAATRWPWRLVWAAALGAVVVLALSIGLVLKITSDGGASSPSAPAASPIAPTGAPQATSTATPVVVVVTPAAPAPAPARPAASASSAATGDPAPSAKPSPKPTRVDGHAPAQDQNPAGFRPKDL